MCVYQFSMQGQSHLSPTPLNIPTYKEDAKRPAVSHSDGHILVQLQSRANLPKGILIHDIEGHRVERGG